MATIWYVLLGFWWLVATPQAWRCFVQAVKTARKSNRTHCPASPGRISIKGYASLAWVVTSFWRSDECVSLVEKFQGTYEGDWYWGYVGPQFTSELEPLTQVDYYTCVWTPAGVIPLPWVDQWFPHTSPKTINWHITPEPTEPRRRSARSQFKG